MKLRPSSAYVAEPMVIVPDDVDEYGWMRAISKTSSADAETRFVNRSIDTSPFTVSLKFVDTTAYAHVADLPRTQETRENA